MRGALIVMMMIVAGLVDAVSFPTLTKTLYWKHERRDGDGIEVSSRHESVVDVVGDLSKRSYGGVDDDDSYEIVYHGQDHELWFATIGPHDKCDYDDKFPSGYAEEHLISFPVDRGIDELYHTAKPCASPALEGKECELWYVQYKTDGQKTAYELSYYAPDKIIEGRRWGRNIDSLEITWLTWELVTEYSVDLAGHDDYSPPAVC